MPWVIERAGTRMTPRGWRPASGGPATSRVQRAFGTTYPTQGEAQEAMDELMQSGLAAMGGKVEVKEVGS